VAVAYERACRLRDILNTVFDVTEKSNRISYIEAVVGCSAKRGGFWKEAVVTAKKVI
jgi:hypothetical protein